MTVADVIVRLRSLLPPGLKGSQTQAPTPDGDLLDIGTSHHKDPPPGAWLAGTRAAGPLPGMLFSTSGWTEGTPCISRRHISSRSPSYSPNTASSQSLHPPRRCIAPSLRDLRHPTRTGSRPEAPGVQGGAGSRRIRAPGGRAPGSRPRHRRPVPPNREPGGRASRGPPTSQAHAKALPDPVLSRVWWAGSARRPALPCCPQGGRPAPTPDPGPQPGRCPGRPLRWPGGRGPPASHVPATAPARVSRRPG